MKTDPATAPLPVRAVLIGASAGGISALLQVLPLLRADLNPPLLVVLHVPPEPQSRVPEVFRGRCHLEVKEAEDKEPLRPGVVYFAPPNYHLQVEPDGHLSLSVEEPVLFSRPSIDVLFETAADAFGFRLLAVLLSGANADGARGLAAVREAGGMVCVQDPAAAENPHMPSAGLKACPDAHVFSCEQIAHLINAS